MRLSIYLKKNPARYQQRYQLISSMQIFLLNLWKHCKIRNDFEMELLEEVVSVTKVSENTFNILNRYFSKPIMFKPIKLNINLWKTKSTFHKQNLFDLFFYSNAKRTHNRPKHSTSVLGRSKKERLKNLQM